MPNKKQKYKNLPSTKRKILLIFIVFSVAVIGFIAVQMSRAASYDGYQRLRVLNTAASEVGNAEWNARVLTYSEGNRENWCADFVSWVYMKAGYAFNTTPGNGRSSWRIPLVFMQAPGVPNLRDYLVSKGAYQTKETGYNPTVGDIVIFARNGRSHTGIVEKFVAGTKSTPAMVYTIEGNTSTANVARRAYASNDATIDGYGTIISAPPVK